MCRGRKDIQGSPPSAILDDEQLSDFLPSTIVPNMDNSNFVIPEAASVSGFEELLGCSDDANAIVDASASLCLDQGQIGEISIIVNNDSPYQTTSPQQLQTSSVFAAPIHSSSQVEIEDDNFCQGVSSLGHTLEDSRVVQESRISRKRTANELTGTSSTFTSSNKQKNRHDQTKYLQSWSHQLAPASDKITRDLNDFLDEHKVDNIASRSTVVKCAGCFRDFTSFYHLNETLQTIRKETSLRLLPASTDIAATNKKLDQLDRLSSTCSVLQRVYLVRLLEHRNKLEAQLKEEGSNPRLPKSKGCNKVASQVLEKMLEDMYPTEASVNLKDCSHPKYRHLKKRLQNNLTAARKWSFIHDRFSLGMLFLIPAGAEYGINNQEYVHSPRSRIRLTSLALSVSRRTPYSIFLISYLLIMEIFFSALQ